MNVIIKRNKALDNPFNRALDSLQQLLGFESFLTTCSVAMVAQIVQQAPLLLKIWFEAALICYVRNLASAFMG